MHLLKKFLQNLYKKVTTKQKVLFNLIFYFALSIGSFWLVFAYNDDTEQEIMKSFEGATYSKQRANRGVLMMVVKLFGKEGLIILAIVCFYVVFRYYFLPNLKYFLSDEVENEEEEKGE